MHILGKGAIDKITLYTFKWRSLCMKNNKINCYQCKHFYITWSKSFPKGCRFFGFKTYKLPSVSVFESSGELCRGFTQKELKK